MRYGMESIGARSRPDQIMQTFEAEILKLEASVLVDPQVSDWLCARARQISPRR
jgi:hypothetical protein